MVNTHCWLFFSSGKAPHQTLMVLWVFLLPCTVQELARKVKSPVCWLISHSCRKSQIFYTERISDSKMISRSSPVWELSKGQKSKQEQLKELHYIWSQSIREKQVIFFSSTRYSNSGGTNFTLLYKAEICSWHQFLGEVSRKVMWKAYIFFFFQSMLATDTYSSIFILRGKRSLYIRTLMTHFRTWIWS